jgi:hypothetical protein
MLFGHEFATNINNVNYYKNISIIIILHNYKQTQDSRDTIAVIMQLILLICACGIK